MIRLAILQLDSTGRIVTMMLPVGGAPMRLTYGDADGTIRFAKYIKQGKRGSLLYREVTE